MPDRRVTLLLWAVFGLSGCGDAALPPLYVPGQVSEVIDTRVSDFRIPVENRGTRAVVLEDAQSSCGCLQVKFERPEIEPKERAFLAADVDLTGRAPGVHLFDVVLKYRSDGHTYLEKLKTSIDLAPPLQVIPDRMSLAIVDGQLIPTEFVVFDTFKSWQNSEFSVQPDCLVVTELETENPTGGLWGTRFRVSCLKSTPAWSCHQEHGEIVVTRQDGKSVQVHVDVCHTSRVVIRNLGLYDGRAVIGVSDREKGQLRLQHVSARGSEVRFQVFDDEDNATSKRIELFTAEPQIELEFESPIGTILHSLVQG